MPDLAERRRVRTARPGYAVLRGVGGAVAALAVVGSLTTVVPEMARSERVETASLTAMGSDELLDGATSVLVTTASGDVAVREATGGEPATVTADLTWTFVRPVLTVETDDAGRLVVDAQCPGSSARCVADLSLVVPEGADVQVRTTFGDVRADVSGPLSAQTTTGDVAVTGASDRVVVRATAGDVTVAASTVPDLVEVTTTLGEVRLTLPDTAAYAVRTTTSMGTPTVHVRQDSASAHEVVLTTTLGDIRVDAARP